MIIYALPNYVIGKIGETGDSRLRGNDGKHGLLRAGALAMTTHTDRHNEPAKLSGKKNSSSFRIFNSTGRNKDTLSEKGHFEKKKKMKV
jgi:hypothetical protein